MIRRDKHKFTDGTYKTQIRVIEGYRDSKTSKPKQKTIKSFGYSEDQTYQDLFMKSVEKFDAHFTENKRIVINETPTKPFYEDDSANISNFAYRFLETIYDNLNIGKVLGS